MVRRPKQLGSEWVASGIVTKELGFAVLRLWKLRNEGLLREGYHWVNIARPQAARPTYRWHLDRIRQTLETPQEER
ncbi:MAG: DNA-binding protein [Leptolyngbyaceae cyanobacterium SM1_3_5]|nr:DNA-binding protein [Leptolyngbyaceae cyanobacterium SM1_3_5]